MIVFVAGLVLTGVYVWFSPAGAQAAPDVKIPILNTQRIVDLKQYSGRPVLVTFWATSCVVCMQEMPHLISLYNELHAKGLEIVGVAMDYDPPNLVVETVEQWRVPYTISLDLDGRIARAFDGVRLIPANFLINPEGRIVFKQLGELEFAQLREDIVAILDARTG